MLVPDVAAQVAGTGSADLAHQHAHLARVIAEDTALRSGAAAPSHQVAVPVEGEGKAVLVVQMVLQLGALKQDYLGAHFAPEIDVTILLAKVVHLKLYKRDILFSR